MNAAKPITEMDLDGGVPCLDFVNSFLHDQEEGTVERIHHYNDFLILAARTSLLPVKELKTLERLSKKQSKEAESALQHARKVRQILYEIFYSIAHGKAESIDKPTLQQCSTYLSKAQAARHYVAVNKQLTLTWKNSPPDLLLPVWAMVLSAYDLLHFKPQEYIRQCEGCAWLFLDETKNHRRKWCNMAECGSSAKAKRYYQKQKRKT